MTSEDKALLLYCIHNALWMADHESQVQTVDEHIAVLNPAQKTHAIAMLHAIMED